MTPPLPQLPPLLPLPDGFRPEEVARHCAGLPGFVFFDTARPDPTQPGIEGTGGTDGTEGQWSLLAAHPAEIIQGHGPEVWQRLRDRLQQLRTDAPESGIAAGWIEYDGTLCFGLYSGVLAYRHGANGTGGEWSLWGDPQAVQTLLRAIHEPLPPPASLFPPPCFQPDLSRSDYLRMVARAQEYIAAGDIYQVNITHRFTASWQPGRDPYPLYQALRRVSPAPYAAYLSLGGRQVLSSSPELFLALNGRTIETRPIKGTRPRGRTEPEDRQRAEELRSSPKEAAELVMITDLERNDLGQICAYGSVHVRDLLKLEQYEQVFHLVSTVCGRLRDDIDPVSALLACFPGGSITGAPKKRAREIIAELEPSPRGLYTGAIGYFGYNGRSCFNIAIRTLMIEGSTAHFHAGAGIVADSDPQAEWEETLHKASGILLAAAASSSPEKPTPHLRPGPGRA